MFSRRAFLLATATTCAGAVLPVWAQGTRTGGGSPALATLFDQLFQEGLQQRPEGATQLGLDKG